MSPSNKLIDLYRKLMDKSIDTLKSQSMKLKELVAHAKEKTAEMEETAKHELEEVGEYLERDLNDIATHFSETSHEISDWLKFELELVEDDLFHRLLEVADPTKLALLKLQKQAGMPQVFKSGEVTTAGTLVCSHCGHSLQLYKTGQIPPCPRCHQEEFNRD